MNNIKRQASLDKQKYFASQKANKDLSGKMNYCKFCNLRKDISDFNSLTVISHCSKNQSIREKYCCCAKAYNKMYKTKKKNKIS